MQDGMARVCDKYKFTVSTKKTEVVHKHAPGKPYNDSSQWKDKNVKLLINALFGSTLPRAVHIDEDC